MASDTVLISRMPPHVRLQLLGIGLLALMLRGWVAVTTDHALVTDETSYDETAWSIATGQGYVLDDKSVSGPRYTFKAPGYSAFVGGMYRLWGRDVRPVRVVQAVLGASLCLLIVWLGWRLMGPAEGLAAGWIAAIYPPFVLLPQWLLSENLYLWLVVVMLGCLAEQIRAPRGWKAALTGAVCGLSILTRSVGLLLPLLFAGLIVAAAGESTRRQRIGHALLVLAASAAMVLPWTVRNYFKTGSPVLVSTEGGRAFYSSWVHVPEGKLMGFGITDPATLEDLYQMGEVGGERYLYDKVFAFLQQEPLEAVRLAGLKTLYFWSPFDWEILSEGTGVYNAGFVFLIPFMLGGCWLAGRYPAWASRLLGWCVLYFFVISVAFCGSPRYRLPIEPLLILLAASGAHAWVASVHEHQRRWTVLAGGWAVANVGAAVFSLPVKVAARSVLEWMRIW